MDARNAEQSAADSGLLLKGGYMLHSSQSRKAAAKMSLGYMLGTAVIILALAVQSGEFSALTAVLLLATTAAFAVIRRTRWDEVSLVRLTALYWSSVVMFVAIALDFGYADVLLGLYPSLLVLTDAWWYRRWVCALNLVVGFGIFTAFSFLIAGDDALGSVLIEVPLMLASIVTLASISNTFVSSLFHRQHLGGTVMSLMHALHARDGYSARHSADALSMAMAVGDRLDLSAQERNELADVALMHDIGKIGIPSAILQKPDSLDESEWAQMREHPEIGARIVGDLPGFESVADAIRHARERWDGEGYPSRMAGGEIPVASRIVLVCDAYLAMTSDRPYRSAMSPAIAREELLRNAGTQFDPDVVTAFLDALDDGFGSPAERNDRWEMTSLIAQSVSDDDRQSRPSVEEMLGDDDGRGAVEQLARQSATISSDLMRKMTVRTGLLSAVVSAAYFIAFGHVDLASGAFVGWFLATALFSQLLDSTRLANPWYLLVTAASYVIAPIAAVHFDQPAMLMFVLLPATAGMRRFWNSRWIRIPQIVAVVASFAVLPIVLFGMSEFPRAIVGLRAFPMTVILVGFLTEHLWKVRFERSRFVSTVRSLLAALQARDGYTGDHSEETLRMVMGVADQLGLDAHQRNELADVALLHDVGKIGIADSILNKPGKLDEHEWEAMRQHPSIGEEIVSKIPGFEDVAKAIRHEHERWDGGGYPDGISGDEIPLSSRIVLVCDAYHAMMSDRPYRKALGLEVARDELLKNAGSQFDPRVVNALLAAIDNRTGEVVPANELGGGDAETTEDEIDHSGMQGVGMSAKAGWKLAATLYGVGGVSYLLIWLGSDLPLPIGLAFSAGVAALASVFWMIGARYFPDAEWGPHLRISFGIALIGYDCFVIGAPVAVVAPLMLFPILGSAYLHGPRLAIPYCVTGAVVVTVAMLAAPPPSTPVSAVVAMIAFCSVSLAAVWAQHQLRAMVEMNHRLSTTDPLTGCANVRRLRARLKQDLVGASGQYRVAVYAIDLDDFKQVNDRFSHTKGDQLLKAVAWGLSDELDAGDLLVRRGGDEFAIVVAISEGRDLEELRSRLARAVKRAREEVCPQVNPNASVGYAIHRDGEAADALLLRADEALHLAKLDAHPDRRQGNDGVRNINDYRRAIAAHPVERSGSHGDEADEVEITRWISRSLGTYTAWIVGAWISATCAAVFALSAITGLVPELGTTAPVAMIAVLAALAPLSLLASRFCLPEPWLHAYVIALFALLTGIIMRSGESSPELVDLYVFPVLFALYFLPPKRAVGYFGAGSVLFAAMLYSSDYPFTTARVLMTYLVMLMMGGMLVKARQATLAFAARAVEMSVVDPLTGAANLRGLRQRVADEILRSELTGKQVAVLGIDIDDFKSVNDRYSHARGDSVLRATVDATRQCLRDDELVARRGGDEFAAVCAVRTAEDAEAIADRIRETVARARAELCPDLLATASVAVTIRAPGEGVDEFLARVDDRLHDEKLLSRATRDDEVIQLTA